MIKIITALVCGFAAMLMLIISLATTFWIQWTIPSEGHIVYHYQGLFRQCWEARDNVTDDILPTSSYLEVNEDCTKWFEGSHPGKRIMAFVLMYVTFAERCWSCQFLGVASVDTNGMLIFCPSKGQSF